MTDEVRNEDARAHRIHRLHRRPDVYINDDGHDVVARVGIGNHFWTDLYHHVLTCSWPRFMGWSTIGYVLINLGFALLYRCGHARINGAADLDLLSLFFFSVQTLSTVGYGVMAPTGHMANALVSIEALLGMMVNALSTGVVFARFSRPRAQILFSKQALISRTRAPPALCLRLANARRSAVLAMDVEVTLSHFAVGEGGYPTRFFTPLVLLQWHIPVLRFACTLVHPLDKVSPLTGKSRDELEHMRAQLLVTVRGTDEATGQPVLSQRSYTIDDILDGYGFVDMISRNEDGLYLVDYSCIDRINREKTMENK